ncbi:uncharacterized protein LOC134695727 [Mytilus trossulus]|uniref:uncharacterized protein LOC134695727 n=1 Tax=Mytilus trossulus TaxID=6551 RepID=UPI003004FB2D
MSLIRFILMGRRKKYNVAECSNYERQVNPEEDVEYTYWCCFPWCKKKKRVKNNNTNNVTSTSTWSDTSKGQTRDQGTDNQAQQEDTQVKTLESLERELDGCKRDLTKCHEEKNDLALRLSELMGKQLQENNPQITNLNDPNRPQKLSEMLSDIYDNEWLDAFTGLQSQNENQDEQSTVDILFNLLKVIYEETLDQVGKFSSHIQEWFVGNQQCPHSRILEFAVSISSSVIRHLQTEIEKVLLAKLKDSIISICTIYIQRCVEMCFYMRIKSPEMYLQFDCDMKYIDKTSFKPYTKDGDTLDYVVWPALFLFKEGPLMNRGVVQCK